MKGYEFKHKLEECFSVGPGSGKAGREITVRDSYGDEFLVTGVHWNESTQTFSIEIDDNPIEEN